MYWYIWPTSWLPNYCWSTLTVYSLYKLNAFRRIYISHVVLHCIICCHKIWTRISYVGFCVIISLFAGDAYVLFTHVLQGCFTGSRAIAGCVTHGSSYVIHCFERVRFIVRIALERFTVLKWIRAFCDITLDIQIEWRPNGVACHYNQRNMTAALLTPLSPYHNALNGLFHQDSSNNETD